MAIISTLSGQALTDAMNQVRNILRIGVTAEDLPDNTILEPAFVRRAELAVYAQTDIANDAAFDELAADDPKRERLKIATLYRTAALLVPALPDIVREQFQSELRQYVQMDWEQKINFFIGQANDTLQPDIPADAQVSSVGSVGSSYTRFTAF